MNCVYFDKKMMFNNSVTNCNTKCCQIMWTIFCLLQLSINQWSQKLAVKMKDLLFYWLWLKIVVRAICLKTCGKRVMRSWFYSWLAVSARWLTNKIYFFLLCNIIILYVCDHKVNTTILKLRLLQCNFLAGVFLVNTYIWKWTKIKEWSFAPVLCLSKLLHVGGVIITHQ